MGPVLIFHRLLLEVVRDWMAAEIRVLWAGAAVQLLDRAFPNDSDANPLQWPLCARSMPHVVTVEAFAPRTGAAGRTLARLVKEASNYLIACGDRDGALALTDRLAAGATPLEQRETPLDLATVGTPANKIFLVHGRDRGAMHEVARFLERLRLEVVILHEQRNASAQTSRCR